uniref:Uncharacterized protein n=1 Tax=Astatotilapia calliptera TaxID=8154 RepID=A0A3P8PLJ2_ASTCA
MSEWSSHFYFKLNPSSNTNCNLCFTIMTPLFGIKHCVLGQLTGEKQANCGLDLSGGDGGALVVVGQAGGFSGDTLEDVIDERIHDAHGLRRDAGVGVDLLQHLVHVDGVALLPGLSLLLAALAGGLGHGFLGALFGR